MSEDRDAILARRRRFIAVALTALGGSAHCRPEAPQRTPEPDVRVAPSATGTGWRSNDADEDGVAEPDDACPDVAEDPDKIDDADGCPETDVDKDSVADEVDACPREPGRDESRLGRGCPCLTILRPSELVITEEIRYGHGETKVPRSAEPLLAHITRVLTDHPDLVLIVEGHCEAKELARACEARAANVVDALATGGVRRERLVAKGMGGPPQAGVGADRAAARIVRFRLE